MRRRSVLLGVALVAVINEELFGQLVGDKLVAGLPDSSAFEEKAENLEVSPLKEPREGFKEKFKPAVADEVSLLCDIPVKVVGSTTVGREPGFSVEV